jgi:hypothetical protein
MSLLDRANGVLLRNFERPTLAARDAVGSVWLRTRKMVGDLGLRDLRNALRSKA